MPIDERSTGIVLRVRPLTETSLIVHWLTVEQGRIATVAKGARRAKSPYRGKLDLFYVADFTFTRSKRSELHTLRELNLRATHSVLRQDLAYIHQVSYCAALIEQATEIETPLPGLFALFEGFVVHISRHVPSPINVFAFELKLLEMLGLNPSLEGEEMSEGAKRIVARFLELDWPALPRMVLSHPQIRELGQFLHRFLTYHLERYPRSRGAALGASLEGV